MRTIPMIGLAACVCSVAIAQPRVLFIRGADRSGGFLEAGDDEDRTEQLADIENASTSGRNHGWFELAEALRSAGFALTQIEEPLASADPSSGATSGALVDFSEIPLGLFDLLVFGSNNAAYPPEQVDRIEAYMRAGGAALFISDANFGGSWADAPTSDQPFLDRIGWAMQQDRGTYTLRRDDGDFLAPDHPILAGVDAIDGEGVSPIVVPDADPVPGVSSRIVVRADPGAQTRNNDRFPGAGTSRPVGPRDAACAIATIDRGRVAGHIDRNTFFNLNGAGTNINRFDNRTYAINLFGWLTSGPGLACGSDLTGDGASDLLDVRLAQKLLASASPEADFDGDGVVTIFDFARYLSLFDDGCP
ncbi:MAG: GC-type dockerin domain-anchored protein [Planctomycetota bacterium]